MKLAVRLAGLLLAFPALGPSPVQALPVAGNYVDAADHPRVFTTPDELKQMAARIARPASYSAARFGRLAKHVARDIATPTDWNATYSGCDLTP